MADTPPAPANKKKRQRMILIGAAGAALLLFLYMRSRSSAASTNATSGTADQQNAYNQGMQAQAAQDAAAGGVTPSTFADNGANAAALGNAVTTGLQGVQDTLSQLPAALQPATIAPSNGSAPAPAAVVTINTAPTPGPPVGTGTNAAPSTQKAATPTVSKPVAAARAAAAGKTGAAYNKAFNQAFNQAFNKHYLAAHPKK